MCTSDVGMRAWKIPEETKKDTFCHWVFCCGLLLSVLVAVPVPVSVSIPVCACACTCVYPSLSVPLPPPLSFPSSSPCPIFQSFLPRWSCSLRRPSVALGIHSALKPLLLGLCLSLPPSLSFSPSLRPPRPHLFRLSFPHHPYTAAFCQSHLRCPLLNQTHERVAQPELVANVKHPAVHSLREKEVVRV